MLADSSKVHKKKGWGAPEGVLLGFLAFKIPGWFLGELVPLITPLLPQAGNFRAFVLYLLFEGLLIGAVYLLVRFYRMRLRDIGLGGIKPTHLLLAVAGCCTYFALSLMAYWLVSSIVVIPEETQDIGFSAPQGLLEQAVVFVALVFVVPLAEELLFRGFLQTGIRRDFSFITTALVVSILFGLAHGQLGVGLDVFVLSLVLCYLREKTGSLWPGIFAHGLKNSVAFFTLFIYNVH